MISKIAGYLIRVITYSKQQMALGFGTFKKASKILQLFAFRVRAPTIIPKTISKSIDGL